MKHILFATASLFAACVAHAQSAPSLTQPQFHGELSYAGLKLQNQDTSVRQGAPRGMVGVKVHPNVALEAMIAPGAYGVYVKPSLQLTPKLQAFARLGRLQTDLDVSSGGRTVSLDGGDFSYGAGLSYQFTPRLYATADYLSYYSKGDVKADGFTVGIGYKF